VPVTDSLPTEFYRKEEYSHSTAVHIFAKCGVYECHHDVTSFKIPKSSALQIPQSMKYAAATSRDRTLPPLLNGILPSSVLLRGVSWFKTDVSGRPVCPIFKGQIVQASSWTV
jgi:hypothetical protein